VTADPELLIVGRIRKAHGIKGEVVVELITDAPDAVFASGRRLLVGTTGGEPTPDEPPLVVEAVRPFGEGLLVHFEGVPDRTAAEAWRDRYLFVPAAETAPPAEGEAYLHELVGMQAVTPAGAPLGAVVEIYELPQGLALEVRRGAGPGTVVLPAHGDFLREIDRAGRRIVLDLPEGFFE
jgi:16S rRNA processing protein RimM